MTKLNKFIALIIALSFINAAHAYDQKFFDLCRAASHEELAKLDLSNLINDKTQSGFTCLMAAAESNTDYKVINILINSGCDVNQKMFGGMTALLWACWRNKNPEVIKALIANGADIYAESDNGKNALDYVYMNSNLLTDNLAEVVRCLEPNAVININKEIKDIKIIKEEDIKQEIKIKDVKAPAAEAEISKDVKAAAHITTINYYGITDLMTLAENSDDPAEILKLIEQGADVNARDDAEQTALMYAAVSNQNPEIISALLKSGADVNARDDVGRTALMLAVSKNPNLDVIKTLVKADGIEINAVQERNGWTALFWAAYSASNPEEVINILLDNGADAKIKGRFGESATAYARRNKNFNIKSEGFKRLENLSK